MYVLLLIIKVLNSPHFFTFQMRNGHAIIVGLGYGFTHVSVFTAKNGNVEIKSQGGAAFGSSDMVLNMVNFFVEEYKSTHDCDPTEDILAMNRLKIASTVAKKMLDVKTEASIDIMDFMEKGETFNSEINRGEFDHLNEQVYEDVMSLVKVALQEAHIEKDHIEQVIVFGSSSGVIKLREMLKHFFRHCRMWAYMDASIDGAAMIAASYNKMSFRGLIDGSKDVEEELEEDKTVFLDVTQQTFGVEIAGGAVELMIEPNLPLPINVTKMFTTTVDDQTDALIQVYEGTNSRSADNDFLAEFRLKDLQASPHGQLQIAVTFEVDKYNTLRVMVCEKGTKNHVEKTIEEPELKMKSFDQDTYFHNMMAIDKYDE